jgi:translation elongation factor P/translation initiation factor 5A
MAKSKAKTTAPKAAKKSTTSTSEGLEVIDAKGRKVTLARNEDNTIVVSKDRTTHRQEFQDDEMDEAVEYFEFLKVCTQN